MTAPQGVKNVFKHTFDQFSQMRSPAWKDFGDYSPPVMRPGEFMGYVGGRATADYVNDATRSWIWRWNALQAQTTDLGREVGRRMGLGKRDSMLAGVGLTTAVELASGNVDLRNLGEAGRPQGYRSIFPQENETIDPRTGEMTVEKDFTKSQNPAAELTARYFLGRTGSVLPWDQFKEERPDVSPEQYARHMKKHRDRTFFGVENRDPKLTALAGGLIGGAVTAATKKPMPLVKGIVGGYMAPGAADFVSEVGILTGTRESLDDPVGDIRMFGYRLPVAKVAGAAALTLGMGVGAKKLYDSGALNRQGPLKKLYDAIPGSGKLWDDAAKATKETPATINELKTVANRLGKDYPSYWDKMQIPGDSPPPWIDPRKFGPDGNPLPPKRKGT